MKSQSSNKPSLSKLIKLVVSLCFFYATAVLTTSCTKDANITVVAPTYSSLYSNVFYNGNTGCVSCHAPGESAYDTDNVGIDFTSSSNGYSTLVGPDVMGNTSVGTCSAVELVDPGSPTSSYLAAVLISSYNSGNVGKSGCTPYNVHLSDQNLSTEELSALEEWITNGAQNN